MITDFLGQTIEVGDQVIYTPSSHGAELVLAEVLEIREVEKQYWNNKLKAYESRTELHPTLQPLDGTYKGRFRKWEWDDETDTGHYKPIKANKARLQYSEHLILWKKKSVEA